MALVTRYFSTSSAGAGDGTTWANRAALLPSGNWSSIITGHNFAADTLLCLVGPGSYSCSQQLTATLITTDPTALNPLVVHGCDSSGVALEPAASGWVSAAPAWDDSALPVIATTTNVGTSSVAHVVFRLIKFTASGRNGAVLEGFRMVDWCSVVSSTANTVAVAINQTGGILSNSLLHMGGATYQAALYSFNPSDARCINCRITGVAGTSGDRDGVQTGTSTTRDLSLVGCTIVGFTGKGINCGGTHAGIVLDVARITVVGCGSDGISSVAAAAFLPVRDCYISGCGGYGIVIKSGCAGLLVRNRIRSNTSGAVSAASDIPELDSDTSSGTDAAEFVDATNGDYRIKATSALWGEGYGAGDEIPTAASIAAAVWARSARTLTS